MKITEKEAYILAHLTSGPSYGTKIVKDSGGALKKGSVFVLLGRLQAKGCVTSEREMINADVPTSVPRRFYTITETGRRALLEPTSWAGVLQCDSYRKMGASHMKIPAITPPTGREFEGHPEGRAVKTIATKDLAGPALDWAVEKANGRTLAPEECWKGLEKQTFRYLTPPYSTDWAVGGLVIEREDISVQCYDRSGPAARKWCAYMPGQVPHRADEEIVGTTALVAAMRCYVLDKLGASVAVPEGLAP